MIALLLAVACMQSTDNALEYVRAHRDADAALVAGKLEDARAGFERLLALSPKNAVVAYARACVESRAANKNAAIEWLERAVQWGYADADVALWDEDLASLRGETKFIVALSRMRDLAPEVTGRPTWVGISDGRRGQRGFRVMTTDPSGKHVVVARPGGVLLLLDAQSGHELRISSGRLRGDAVALVFHPNGKEVFALTADGKLQAWNIFGESEPSELEAKPAEIHDLPLDRRWGPRPLLQIDRRGDHLLVLMGGHTSLVETRGAELHRWNAAFGRGEGGVVAWSPEFERIAWCDGGTIRFANGLTGEPSPEFIETPSGIDSLAFSHDGALLATGHEDGVARLWNLDAEKQRLARSFSEAATPSEGSTVDVISISPDSRWVADGMSDSGVVEIWNLSTGILARRLQGAARGSDGLREPFQWTPDARRLWTCFPVPGTLEAALDESFSVSVEQPVACLRWLGSDRAVALGYRNVFALDGYRDVFAMDPRTGACLWTRPDLGRAGEIVHCSSGYFTTDLENLDELFIRMDDQVRSEQPLERLATRLFDPKRVRAARAGIPLLPAKLDESPSARPFGKK